MTKTVPGQIGQAMTSTSENTETLFLGDMPPLLETGRKLPDKRRVSLRWLSGAVLTGVTSAFLMGGALFAALDGRHQLTLPAQAYEQLPGIERPSNVAVKGARPGLKLNVDTSDTDIMMVSTVSREGNRDVVKVKPFLRVEAPLAAAPKADYEYPKFNALNVFSDSEEPETFSASSDLIYGADVDTEVALTFADFDHTNPLVTKTPRQRASDIEELIRTAAPGLGSGATTIASLTYFDPRRFSFTEGSNLPATGVTIVAENMTVLEKQNPRSYTGRRYEERVVKVRTEAPVSDILISENMDGAEASLLQKVLSSDLGSETLRPGDRVRINYETQGSNDYTQTIKPGRISIYRSSSHLVSIARTDSNRFVYTPAPEPIPQIEQDGQQTFQIPQGRLPSTYDAIYRAALSEGLNEALAAKLIRIFSFDVDFNSTISPTDQLSVFVSLEDGQKTPTEKSEILYASIKLGTIVRKYYRFRDQDGGRVDYYDETGKSAKKFLLRQPVPNGRFRSPFGSRWHPILKYRKMHWGVDWAAPRGTPILSAGNGVILTSGWQSGYGRQTKVQHANGYVTSYSHQTRIAKGIKPGVRVRQGQVIGYVGSTGLSTGPHLHYEVIVNGTKVDPMRIRLPKGRVLKGTELATYQSERDRIDDLLSDGEDTEIARY
ncbi:MAG: M23 family metallopeptidase [Pseudomonadota bacterium]